MSVCASDSLSPLATKAAMFVEIDRAMDTVRLPSSQITFILHNFLDRLPGSVSEPIRERLQDGKFAIALHRCAKEAMLLSTLKEMFKEPAQLDDYLASIAEQTADPVLAEVRTGMIGMMMQ